MGDRRPALSLPWLAVAAVLAAAAGLGTWALTADDAPPPATTTTTVPTTTSTVPDPVEVLAPALAESLAAEAGIEPDEMQLRCLSARVLAVLPEERLAELQATAAGPDGLSETERESLTRAVVECLGSEAAEALLGDGTTTTIEVAELPDEGSD